MSQNPNMELYEFWREVPLEAQKKIGDGRKKGFTDISPMWRIKMLTERFGPCGIGWIYTIDKQWITRSEDTGEEAAFCNISLYIKIGDEWSKPIPGTGGNTFISNEKGNTRKYMNDECYKMALTDAISVACKALGIGADVYWQNDPTKYSSNVPEAIICTECNRPITQHGNMTPDEIALRSSTKFGRVICVECARKIQQAQEQKVGAAGA